MSARGDAWWVEAWRGTTWDLDGTIVLVVGPGAKERSASCFILHDSTGWHAEADQQLEDWTCSWFTDGGVRIA